MDVESAKAKFDLVKSKHNIDYEAKEEQLTVACSVLNGRNVLGLLPTGFGKTLCIVIPTMLFAESDTITLVVSPLTSLIDDQMARLEKMNFKCAKITSLGDMDKDVITGECTVRTIGGGGYVFLNKKKS